MLDFVEIYGSMTGPKIRHNSHTNIRINKIIFGTNFRNYPAHNLRLATRWTRPRIRAKTIHLTEKILTFMSKIWR